MTNLDLASWLLLAPCLLWCCALIIATRIQRVLTPLEADETKKLELWPRLSVIIPACNEEATLEAALLTLLEQSYPNLELVVIDDRSTDGTGAIVDRLAARDPRVKPVHLTELPAGWLGKLHAMHAGAEIASGDWLLFTDADVHYAKGALELAIFTAVQDELDHLSLLPKMHARGPLLRGALIAFGASFLLFVRPEKLRDPNSPVAIGVGAFNLVRRSAFQRTPGFAWLKMEIADDVGLARLMKSHGARTDVHLARELLSLEWYESTAAMIRGLEKNIFAVGAQFSLLRAVVALVLGAFSIFAPIIALTVGGSLAAAGGLALLAMTGLGIITARFLALPWWSAFFGLLGAFVMAFALIRSTSRTLRAGGVRWRETFYTIDELRRGQRVRL